MDSNITSVSCKEQLNDNCNIEKTKVDSKIKCPFHFSWITEILCQKTKHENCSVIEKIYNYASFIPNVLNLHFNRTSTESASVLDINPEFKVIYKFFENEDFKFAFKEAMKPIIRIIYNEIYIYIWLICIFNILLILIILANFILLLRFLQLKEHMVSV